MYFLEPDILSILFGHVLYVTMECTQRWIDCCVFVCMPVLFSLSFIFSISFSRSLRLMHFSLHSITSSSLTTTYIYCTHKHTLDTRTEHHFVGWKAIHVNMLWMLFVYRNYLPTQTISYWRNVIPYLFMFWHLNALLLNKLRDLNALLLDKRRKNMIFGYF